MVMNVPTSHSHTVKHDAIIRVTVADFYVLSLALIGLNMPRVFQV